MRIPVRVLALLLAVSAPLFAQQAERMVNRSSNPLLANFRFRSIGPASMGGRIDDVEAFPGNPSIIYIGYAVGGVWKSVNMGTTWEPVFDEQPVASIGDIAIHPTNPDIVYVGTGESNNRQTSSFGDGMYKTTDGGKTWTHIGLRETQSISRVVIDPRNPEIVYVSATGQLFGPSPDRGVYKTTDGGKTWNKIKYIDENTGFTDLAMDPTNSNILYGASYQRRRTSCCFNGGGPGSAVWKTTDAGRTWTKITGPGLSATGSYGRIAIAISKSNPNTVYFQIEGGDVGRVGTTAAAAPTAAQAAAAAAAAAEAGGGGGGRGGGYDWCNNAGPGRGFGGGGGRAGADTPQNPPALNPADGGVFRTTDGGRTWTLMSNCNARPMYFSQLRVDPTNPNIVYASGLPWTKSMDGGKTFATLDAAGGNNSSGHVDNHAMWINPNNPRHLMIGNDGGINISWDQGHTWDYINTMAAGTTYWVSADMRRPYRVYTGLQDNGSWGAPSSTRGNGITNAHWYGVGGGDGFQTAADPTAWNIIFTESQNGNTNRYDLLTGATQSVRPTPVGGGTGLPPSTVAGCNDGRIAGGAGGGGGGGGGGGRGGGGGGRGNVLNAVAGDGARFNWNTPFLLSPHNPKVLWLGGARVYRSENQGDTYMQGPDVTKRIDRCKIDVMAPGGTTQLSKNDGLTSYSTIISLSESPVRAGVVWAGTDDGNLSVSRDNGVTFTEVGKNIPGMPQGALNGETNPYWIARIDAGHFDAGTAYVAIDGHRSNDLKPYAFVTTDYGATWRNISSNLPAYGNLQVIKEDPKNPDLLYVGTEFGLFISLNRGQSWEKFMNNYPTVRTDDIYIHPRENDLIIASHGRSIYIADDITPLQQLTPAVRNSDAHLFDVRPAVAWLTDRQDNHRTAAAQKSWRAENAPRGAAISYYLRGTATPNVTLAITDMQGRTLCSGPVANVAGINRVQWGLTAPMLAGGGGGGGGGRGGRGGGGGGGEAPAAQGCGGGGAGGGRGGGGGFGGGGGGGVEPGTYIATLTVGGRSMSKSVTVLADIWMKE